MIARILATIAVVLWPVWAQAADCSNLESDHQGAFSLLFENDIFFNQDRHYTTGVGIAYTTPRLLDERKDCNWDWDWGWAVDAARHLPTFDDTDDVRATFQLAQDIFTPTDTLRAVPDPTDRPYAGYLYVSIGLASTNLTEDTDALSRWLHAHGHLDQAQLQVGIIGPASLAGNSQNWVHDILGENESKGWSHQLRDEPGIELTVDRTLRLLLAGEKQGLEIDLLPFYGAAIGNVYDYVNTGAMARIGFGFEDDFGPLRMNPTLPGVNFFSLKDNGLAEAYIFAGVDARVVGHNIFLDGNTFHDSPSVDKNLFVGDAMFGFAVAFDRFRLAFTHVIRTREFISQTSTDQFGAVSLTVRI